MGFNVKLLKSGNQFEPDKTGGGNLTVVRGKAKQGSVKAWRDDGDTKKGDEIKGIEFTLEVKNTGNLVGQTYDASTKKFITSTTALGDTVKGTLFLAGNNGLAYLNVLSSLAECRKIGILPKFDGQPEDDKTPLLIEGFSGKIFVGNSEEIESVVAGDYKPNRVKMFLFDEFEPKDCNLEFAAPATGYKGGASSQTEKDKLSDRTNFIQAVLTDASPEQQLFVKLLTIDGAITHKEFISLMFQ